MSENQKKIVSHYCLASPAMHMDIPTKTNFICQTPHIENRIKEDRDLFRIQHKNERPTYKTVKFWVNGKIRALCFCLQVTTNNGKAEYECHKISTSYATASQARHHREISLNSQYNLTAVHAGWCHLERDVVYVTHGRFTFELGTYTVNRGNVFIYRSLGRMQIANCNVQKLGYSYR